MPLKIVSFIRAIPIFKGLVKQIEALGDLSINRDKSFNLNMKKSNGLDMAIEKTKDFTGYILPQKDMELFIKTDYSTEIEI